MLPWSILQYFWPALSDHQSWNSFLLSLFFFRLRQVWLFIEVERFYCLCLDNKGADQQRGYCDIFIWAASWENQQSAYAKTKTQISFAVTAKQISIFVFANWIVQYLYFLNTKFQASSHLQWLHSLVCVGPGQNPHCWFSHVAAHLFAHMQENRFSHGQAHIGPRSVYSVPWRLSSITRKPVFRVSYKMWHKPGCATTEDDVRPEV